MLEYRRLCPLNVSLDMASGLFLISGFCKKILERTVRGGKEHLTSKRVENRLKASKNQKIFHETDKIHKNHLIGLCSFALDSLW